MNKATAVQMRKALEAANAFKQAGIEFIPVPVLDDKDRGELTDDVFRRLSIIEEQARHEQRKTMRMSKKMSNDV